MDIFIPEEYVMRRRSERKAVPGALKKQIWCLNQEGWRRRRRPDYQLLGLRMSLWSPKTLVKMLL